MSTTEPTKTKFIRFPEVIDRTSKSRAAIYALMDRGEFPRPVKLGSKSVAFIEHEVDAWIHRLVAKRDQAQAA